MNTSFSFLRKTPPEIERQIAERIRSIRKRRKISQQKLSELSGVSLGSLKRFEQSGEISLLLNMKNPGREHATFFISLTYPAFQP